MKAANLIRPLGLSARVSAALLIVRLVAVLAFAFHGYGKIQNNSVFD